MISVQYCSPVSPQHFGFCHYPYIARRIKSETLANKIIRIQKCLNIAEVFLFPVSKTTILSLVDLWNSLYIISYRAFLFLLWALQPGSQKPINPSSQSNPPTVDNPSYSRQRVYFPYLSNLTSHHSSLLIPSSSTRLSKVSLTYQAYSFHSISALRIRPQIVM